MEPKQKQLNLDCEPSYDYSGMPEYKNTKRPDPEITATFRFRCQDDYDIFHALIKEHIYDGNKVFDGMQKKEVKTTWFPLNEKASNYNYTSVNPKNPRFPVYIVSKGRWERNPTSRALKEMGVPFYMVVEAHEKDEYLNIVDDGQILILPQKYLDDYDTFWIDDDARKGPGAARNFVWDHSIENGYEWHWVMDDNLESFERLNDNMKVKCTDGTPLYVCEDYVLRYTNIAQAGLNYAIFCPASDSRPPVKINTRIYSCLLIRNDVPYRWRGRYNEDTDLSLRMMKDGWCTVQFNQFLIGKRATQSMRGGNSAEFYDEEGTKNKSQMLADMHPDVARVIWKWNRWHHHVDYKPFKKNILIKKKNLDIKKGINNYGLVLKNISEKIDALLDS